MPLILPGNVGSATGGAFEVANSCRFDDGDNAYMHKSQGGGNRRTFTLSCWFKRGNLGTEVGLFDVNNATQPYSNIRIDSSDFLKVDDYDGNQDTMLITNRKFRDPSAWYHLCVAYDTTQSTASNRIKVYINGTQETSFSTETYPAQNFDTAWNNSGETLRVGDFAGSGWDGYMAEVVMIDGQQLAPTSFGEFDSDSGIWKPIDVSGLTFGTNGFYLDFEDSSNLGNDANGGTDFTEVNLAATDQSTDTCSNNSVVFNPLFLSDGTIAFSEGNLKIVSSGTNGGGVSTFGVSSGKWYIEVKQTGANQPLGNGEMLICVTGDPENVKGSIDNFEGRNYSFGIRNNGGTKFANVTSYAAAGTWHGNWGAGDIISIALDMDNNNVYFAKNGSYADGSGNWDEAFTGSPAAISLSTAVTNYFIGVGHAHSSATGTFEYGVPSGYFALCTKNLAENS
jgi:hypothetical protein